MGANVSCVAPDFWKMFFQVDLRRFKNLRCFWGRKPKFSKKDQSFEKNDNQSLLAKLANQHIRKRLASFWTLIVLMCSAYESDSWNTLFSSTNFDLRLKVNMTFIEILYTIIFFMTTSPCVISAGTAALWAQVIAYNQVALTRLRDPCPSEMMLTSQDPACTASSKLGLGLRNSIDYLRWRSSAIIQISRKPF